MEVESNDDGIFMRENADLSRLLQQWETDEQDGATPEKRLRLDLNRGQSVHVVDAVRKKPLLREDGYQDTFQERQHAQERSYSREYMAQELDRLMALQDDTFYQFVGYVAGFTNVDVLALLNHDDLSRRLLERKRQEQTQRLELDRSLVGVNQKRQQLQEATLVWEATRANLRRLRSDNTAVALLELGERLVEQGWLPLIQLAQAIDAAMLDAPPEDANVPSAEQRADDMTAAAMLAKLVQEGNGTYGVLMRNGQRLRVFFDTKLDQASPRNITHLQRVMTQLREQIARRLQALPTLKGEDMVDSSGALDEEAPSEPVDRDEWLSEDAVLEAIAALGAFCVSWFVNQGAHIEYAQWHSDVPMPDMNYPRWVSSLLNAVDNLDGERHDAAVRKIGELTKLYNVFGSGPPDGQPPTVARLIERATGGRRDNEAVYTAARAIRRHTLWIYFTERSDVGLAVDSTNVDTQAQAYLAQELTAVRRLVTDELEKLGPVLALYFDQVRQALTSEQTLRDANDKAPVLRLNYEMKQLPAQATLAAQSEAMRHVAHHEQLILDPDFELYYSTGETSWIRHLTSLTSTKLTVPLDWLRQEVGVELLKQYPLLALHSLFRAYVAYTRQYQRYANERVLRQQETVETLERKVEELLRERNSLDGEPRRADYVQTRAFTELPMNSGVLMLSPKARAALDRAKNLVAQYCPELTRLPSEDELYGAEAVRSGLANDFARLVACQMSQVGLREPNRYNTQLQTQLTLIESGDVLAALRRYRVRSRGLAGFSIVAGAKASRRDSVLDTGAVHSF